MIRETERGWGTYRDITVFGTRDGVHDGNAVTLSVRAFNSGANAVKLYIKHDPDGDEIKSSVILTDQEACDLMEMISVALCEWRDVWKKGPGQ